MPLNSSLEVEPFDVWEIVFYGVILFIVLKLVYTCCSWLCLQMGEGGSILVIRFLKNYIFTRYSIPQAIISDEDKHLCNS